MSPPPTAALRLDAKLQIAPISASKLAIPRHP
jgi:hypothetical protein